ncbi:MAG TPA: hypothetical protein VGD43_18985 [Micromonospora sp.]
MGWFRSLLGAREAQPDPGRQETLLREVRHRYGAQTQLRFPDQVDAVTRLLDGDDGLLVAARILREVTDEVHGELLAQAAELYRRTGHRLLVDRRNYLALWRTAGTALRWPLFALPGGLHPYAQVAAAVDVLGARAARLVRVTDPHPVLVHVFEVIDLTAAGWTYGRVRVDVDAAALASRLISTGRRILDAMEEPPRLPPPVRDLMRRNNTVDVHDPAGTRVVGTFNLGAELRQTLLT